MIKGRYLLLAVLPVMLLLSACQKNTVSKIPNIALSSFGPSTILVNLDTVFIKFTIVDGDGDIGVTSESQIYLKDSRFDSAGYFTTQFPTIDASVEDPKKGLEAVCTFYPVPQPVPRSDSAHTKFDTLHYEMYITDRAGHESNHVITPSLIIKI